MSERIEKARAVNAILKRQRNIIETDMPKMFNEGMKLAGGDAGKARVLVNTLGESADFLSHREWSVGMVTAPGALVYDPQRKYLYAYSGASEMTHANSTFYPGASGVYYWSIVPEIKEGYKVYPNISGIIVAVKKNEVWWNQAQTARFYWKGADNANCSWPPVAGNEWGVVN